MEQQLILAYYFPQYHSIPENDVVFGKDFTDWNLFQDENKVNTLISFNCKFPIEPPAGLGYYDPTKIEIRRQQANLAKKYGIDGFIFYHYWLENIPVMTNVLDNLLEDGEPDLPFCLCFANESWKHCYGNIDGNGYKSFHPDGSTFRQLYDNPIAHAQYLHKIFQHKNYIKKNNSPILFVYILDSEICIYLERIEMELKYKIYFIANTSAHCIKSNFQPFLNRSFDAYSPFIAHMNHYSPLPQCLQNLPQVYGGLVGWNQSPRRFDHHIHDYSPEQLQEKTANDLLSMSGDSASPQIYALFAWNEWAEGAMLEPNSIYGEGLGLAIRNAKDIVYHLLNKNNNN